MKFELELRHRNVSDEELIEDVKNVAKRTGKETVTMRDYQDFGKYDPTTLQRRFRSWFTVLELAGLLESRTRLNISEEELFDNLKNVWIALERQPKLREVKSPLSRFHATTYKKRFGSWHKALEAFVLYVNNGVTEVELEISEASVSPSSTNGKQPKMRTKREISERLRFSILLRDGFRCQTCGRSPLKSSGVELHVDHIIPWSRGGETTLANLQTKCKECNLGKGNAFLK